MADPRPRVESGQKFIRYESGQVFLPDNVAARIENMCLTDEGTLRSIQGPANFMPDYSNQVGHTEYPWPFTGTMHGIGHFVLNGRDILLVHCGNAILEFQGWLRTWTAIIDDTGTALQTANIPDDDHPRFPTQFELTPSGIVIMPQDCRPYLYDGEVCIPLGYSQAPAPPTAHGPGNGGQSYYHDALQFDPGYSPSNGHTMNGDFMRARCGTIRSFGDALGSTPSATVAAAAGTIEEGTYRYAVQWIDRFGNVSPLSGRSNAAVIKQQTAIKYDQSGPTFSWSDPDNALKLLAASGIRPGPPGTIGRILCRTKDEKHSGTLDLFEVPGNSRDGALAFATIPDNATALYPDNTPDSWLVRMPVSPMPVRAFRLAKMAFGRLWTANWDGEPHRLQPSMPGRFGTFLAEDVIYPDPSAGQITGMSRCAQGLLVFTDTSTYLIVQNADGKGFRQSTVSSHIGCVAPNTVRTLRSGATVWLARDGFYSWNGNGAPAQISKDIHSLLRDVNRARALQACAEISPETGDYYVYVPLTASKRNIIGLVYSEDAGDGGGWKRRRDCRPADLCIARDHRGWIFAAGEVIHGGSDTTFTGVWVLDHEGQSFSISYEDENGNHIYPMIETGWMQSANLDDAERRSAKRAHLWIRECSNSTLTVEVYRDWRMDVVDTQTTSNYFEDDTPPFYGTTLYDDGTSKWRRRRPGIKKVDIDVGSCEVFKLIIRSTDFTYASRDWEFVGISVDVVQHRAGGARQPP